MEKKKPVNLQNKNLLSVWLCNWEDKSSSLQWIRKQYFAYLLRNSQNWLKKFRFHQHLHFLKNLFWRSHSSPGDNCAALYRCVQELVAKSTRLQVRQNRFRSESAQAELRTPPSHNDPGKWALVGLKWCRLTIEAPTVSLNILDGLAALMVLSWTAGTRRGQKKEKMKKMKNQLI